EVVGAEARGQAAEGRLGGVDALRGLAIVTMVAANAGAAILSEPHPFAFRLYGSFAAPIFVTLAGMMVAYATHRDRSRAASGRRHNLRYYLGRAAVILLAAVIVDVGLGRFLPLMTWDVLYTIGLALPAAYLLAGAPRWARWAVPLAIFAATPLVQAYWGYDLEISHPALDTPPVELPTLLPAAAHRFFIDGWFPMFPWLGFALLGVALETLRDPARGGFWLDVRPGAIVLTLGMAVWWIYPGAMATRAGYSELFYPPTPGFLLTATGVLLVLLPLFERLSDSPIARLLQPLGRCSLLIYMVHLALIDRLLRPVARELDLGAFLVVYAGLLLVLWSLALGIGALKRAWRERGYSPPMPLTVLLGG
ncbi:MAG: DUF1624 domain-containing protein, partial [Isosphaeraceae bacterium]|nr:DUF1624 domain-containing protein [Isosphaeraceae bacterium]